MDSPADASLIHALHRASQVAEDRFARELGDSDVTPRQLAVLTVIDAHDGLSQTDIVTATGVDRSTLADIVKRLVERGLIARKRSKEDARAYVVKLTADGRRALATSAPVLARVEAELLESLPTKKRSELIGLLQQLATSKAPVEA